MTLTKASTVTASKINAPAAASALPQGELREISVKYLAYSLARRISNNRHSGTPFSQTIKDFLERYTIIVSRSPEVLAEELYAHILADSAYDSETNQAHRAALKIFAAEFPEGRAIASGWFAGEVVSYRRQRFELTGDACPRCKVNPECYGIGGGVRCLDVQGCGWWFCY